jgi:hypothetical protein
MELDSEIDSFISQIKYTEPRQSDKLAGRNKELSEEPIADDAFYERVELLKKAAELEARKTQLDERRFYVVLAVTVLLFITCFVLSLTIEVKGGSAIYGKTGIFATIVGIFALYLDYERRRLSEKKKKVGQANLLAQSLEVLRNPGDIVRFVTAAKRVRQSTRPRRRPA